jgi:putative heme-binding domain-containing protein
MRLLPFALVVAALASAQSPEVAAGKKLFDSQCALCHGESGTGGRGPSLNRPKLSHAPDDEGLKKVISGGLEPEMPAAWQLNETEVAAVAAYVRSLSAVSPEQLPGDPARGAAVFQAKGCFGCHIVSGKGEGFGPELTEIGSRRGGAFLRQTILHPESSLPEGFLYVSAVPRSGQAVRGIRVNEDNFSVQIKDASGRFHSFRKSELSELRRLRNQTPMPSFEGSLTVAELDDIVAWLAGLKGKP